MSYICIKLYYLNHSYNLNRNLLSLEMAFDSSDFTVIGSTSVVIYFMNTI